MITELSNGVLTLEADVLPPDRAEKQPLVSKIHITFFPNILIVSIRQLPLLGVLLELKRTDLLT